MVCFYCVFKMELLPKYWLHPIVIEQVFETSKQISLYPMKLLQTFISNAYCYIMFAKQENISENLLKVKFI